MMETIIAVGVGVVVGGGILTLVWKILVGDREQKKLDEELARFLPEEKKAEAGKAKK